MMYWLHDKRTSCFRIFLAKRGTSFSRWTIKCKTKWDNCISCCRKSISLNKPTIISITTKCFSRRFIWDIQIIWSSSMTLPYRSTLHYPTSYNILCGSIIHNTKKFIYLYDLMVSLDQSIFHVVDQLPRTGGGGPWKRMRLYRTTKMLQL